MLKKPTKPNGFPLYAHGSGQWAKKVRGKTHYFGTWDDPQAALRNWLRVRDELYAGQTPVVWDPSKLSVEDALNFAVDSKSTQVDTGDLNEKSYRDYVHAAKIAADFLGRKRPIEALRPIDFQDLRSHIAKGRSLTTSKNVIVRIRVLLNYCETNGYLGETPLRKLVGSEFEPPSKTKLRIEKNKKGSKVLTAEQIRQLIDAAQGQIKAMILLGINCGFGQTDCGNLQVPDLKNNWVSLPRSKTGKSRRCPLWPETKLAICEIIRSSDSLVFRTKYGNPWTPTTSCPISREFGKLKKECDLPNVTFYGLRHTFLTIGEETKDFEAVRVIMGHVDASMAGEYRGGVSDERLRAVSDHVYNWLGLPDVPPVKSGSS